ncbi:hypothetical protein SCHPADRAFT_907367 [Schizopora paradoxa]|uniref:Uncharacterized protein n=1 Tax=Schizopora paradoxa TaxID=27342 RepID=A0A0H2RYL8_9AGAM|nr:hypothetical protein SCHPADRAFT_911768 [Schizopora paradoxa]KLO09866.1 hypothetical protein SCHPADRAFT_907367 [Schizopora paradoxa]
MRRMLASAVTPLSFPHALATGSSNAHDLRSIAANYSGNHPVLLKVKADSCGPYVTVQLVFNLTVEIAGKVESKVRRSKVAGRMPAAGGTRGRSNTRLTVERAWWIAWQWTRRRDSWVRNVEGVVVRLCARWVLGNIRRESLFFVASLLFLRLRPSPTM